MKDSQLSELEGAVFMVGAVLSNGLPAVLMAVLALICMATSWLCERIEKNGIKP